MTSISKIRVCIVVTEIKDKVITKDAFELPYTIIKAKHQPTKVPLSTFMVAV